MSTNTNKDAGLKTESQIQPRLQAMRLLKRCTAVAAACLITTTCWASVSPVWRCDLAGHITYADQPCDKVLPPLQTAAAVQRSVDAADPRTTQQRREAQAVASADSALARKLQQERRLLELRSPPPAAAVIIGLPPDPLAKPELKKTSLESRTPRLRRAPSAAPSGAHTSPTAGPASRRGPG